MIKLTDDELKELVSTFNYSNLLERYTVLEEYFDIEYGDVVIDGGAFHGDMAQYFSKKVGSDGLVYSFEAHPINVKILRNFVRINKLENVAVLPIALWNEEGEIPFYLSKYSNAGSPVREFRKTNDNYINIYANSLDNVMKDDRVDFIWTNIEASELRALTGMKNTLKNNDCKLCICTHKVTEDYYNRQDVIDLLTKFGYKARSIDDDHVKWIYAEK